LFWRYEKIKVHAIEYDPRILSTKTPTAPIQATLHVTFLREYLQ
jgi:hypothetical protein